MQFRSYAAARVVVFAAVRAVAPRRRIAHVGPSADALTGRGLAWLKKSDYNRALADLNRAIEADGTKVLTYTARASVYEAQGKTDLASMDLRKAAALPPRSAFDTLAQAEAKRRVERLTKQIPCGGGARTSAGETCL